MPLLFLCRFVIYFDIIDIYEFKQNVTDIKDGSKLQASYRQEKKGVII